MLQISNIDRQDATYNTCAPFQPCTMKLGSVVLTYEDFLSIKVYCTSGTVLPVSMSTVSLSDNGNSCSIEFTDSENKLLGTCTCRPGQPSGYVSTFIFNGNGQVVGHMVYLHSLPDKLMHAARVSKDRTLRTSDFKLLPQCCTAWLQGVSKVLDVGGLKTTGSVEVTAGRYMRAENTVNGFQYSVIGEYNQYNDGICRLVLPGKHMVNGTEKTDYQAWVGSGSLVIRHALTSNIRLLTNDKQLSLSGVDNG